MVVAASKEIFLSRRKPNTKVRNESSNKRTNGEKKLPVRLARLAESRTHARVLRWNTGTGNTSQIDKKNGKTRPIERSESHRK